MHLIIIIILLSGHYIATEDDLSFYHTFDRFLFIKHCVSLYQSTSLSVCLFVCLFPNFSETANTIQQAETFRDDSPWDWEGFRLKQLRIRRTVSREIACIVLHPSGS